MQVGPQNPRLNNHLIHDHARSWPLFNVMAVMTDISAKQGNSQLGPSLAQSTANIPVLAVIVLLVLCLCCSVYVDLIAAAKYWYCI